MKKILATMMALALTIGAQAQQDDGMDAMLAAMIAAKVHQDSIDTSSLVVVYDYECQTQDADDKAVTDRMKVCLQVGQHCTRSFPYRKFRKEREWAEGKKQFAADFLGLKAREYLGGYDFFNEEELVVLIVLDDGTDRDARRPPASCTEGSGRCATARTSPLRQAHGNSAACRD